jgi:hypothetical protein
MSVLSSLKLTMAKSRNTLPPVIHRRNKLIGRLNEQVKLATAMREGKSYSSTRTRIVKNKETGESHVVEQAKRVRAWWFAGEKGKSFLQVKYGAKTLELLKGKNSVEVSSDAELIQTLELIKKAVESGELDQQIEAASER